MQNGQLKSVLNLQKSMTGFVFMYVLRTVYLVIPLDVLRLLTTVDQTYTDILETITLRFYRQALSDRLTSLSSDNDLVPRCGTTASLTDSSCAAIDNDSFELDMLHK